MRYTSGPGFDSWWRPNIFNAASFNELLFCPDFFSFRDLLGQARDLVRHMSYFVSLLCDITEQFHTVFPNKCYSLIPVLSHL